MVDNIPEDKKWECPECASVKIERRKVAVERARLKRVAQGRALVRSATQCCSHFPILTSGNAVPICLYKRLCYHLYYYL